MYNVILFSSLDKGVFSIILRLALPTITASTPAETYFFTSLGVDTPNPIPIGSLLLTIFLVFLIESIAVSYTHLRAPVVPKTATIYKKPVLAFAIFFSLTLFVFGDTKKMVSSLFFLAAFR